MSEPFFVEGGDHAAVGGNVNLGPIGRVKAGCDCFANIGAVAGEGIVGFVGRGAIVEDEGVAADENGQGEIVENAFEGMEAVNERPFETLKIIIAEVIEQNAMVTGIRFKRDAARPIAVKHPEMAAVDGDYVAGSVLMVVTEPFVNVAGGYADGAAEFENVAAVAGSKGSQELAFVGEDGAAGAVGGVGVRGAGVVMIAGEE